MKLEIERKFLITSSDFKKQAYQKSHIRQGFLNSNKHRVVRIRLIDDKAYLTIKGISNTSGTTRLEWEKQIDVNEAVTLLELCEDTIIEKDSAIAVSLNRVPDIPSIKISGRKTATNIKVVAIIAKEICFEPL